MKTNLRLMKFCVATGLTLTSVLANSAYITASGADTNLLSGNATLNALHTTSLFSIQQEKEVTGTVRDNKGTPLPGVTVQVKGTSKGTKTDANGHYKLNAKAGDILVFSSIGMTGKELVVNTGSEFNIALDESVRGLSELVVTALGVKRSEKSTTYATQQLSGVELTKAKDANLMNALSGKTVGVTIARSSSGVGGSVKVLLRGNKSANGSNQPLYVIDGVPMTNFSTQQPNSTWGGNGTINYAPGRDGGDGISNLNPDDIESISILKGASSAALYGSQAANGVILITTKKGGAGQTRVNFSSNLTIDQAAYKPKFQNSYGQTEPKATQSWGAKINNAQDNLSDFFRTGTTLTNAINFSAGSNIMQTYFSYANTLSNGIVPGNKLTRHNINFRETGHFLNDKLTVDGNVNYIVQKVENGPVSGLYFNPLTGLYLFPRGLDISPYKNNYEIMDPERQLMKQNWPFDEDVQQNPYWIPNRNGSVADRYRTMINVSAKYDLTKTIYLQARGSIDRTNDVYESDIYAGTHPVLSSKDGRFIYSNQTTTQSYGDFIANFTIPADKFKINAILGTSITDTRTKGETFDTYNNGLYIPNVFTIQNMIMPTYLAATLPENRSQLQAVFANVNLSFNDWVFLDLTGRNDWSSNLSYTNNYSYFYPSAGLTFMLNQMFTMPEIVNYAKLRGSYAVVGNTVPVYITNIQSHLGSNPGTVNFNTRKPFGEMKPEKTRSLELGTSWRFVNNRLNFDFTYYKTNTINQYFEITVPPGTGYSTRFINGGNLENKGVEIMLGYDILKNSQLTWNSAANFSTNKNTVKELAPGIDQFILTEAANNSYQSMIVVGGSYGDIYGKKLQRDEQGRVKLSDKGKPLSDDAFTLIGNPNPKWQAGWNNNIGYKNFSLSFLIDGKFGGQVLSITQSMLDLYGVSKETGDARNAGGVIVNAVDDQGKAISKVDAETWYTSVGGRAGVSGEYIYSASNVRLREVSLGYSLPLKGAYVKALKLSLVGRNLAYIYKKAPFDPELTMSTGNGLSGVDVFSLPATRSFGLNVNVSF